jgi:hypothetical protein
MVSRYRPVPDHGPIIVSVLPEVLLASLLLALIVAAWWWA